MLGNELLAHFNIKTTDSYLHASKKMLVNIVSPFDDLWENRVVKPGSECPDEKSGKV